MRRAEPEKRAGFFLLSLVVLAVMLPAGILYALVGRFGSQRWVVLTTTFLAVGLGNYIASSGLI